jgi:hypothetical protein
LSNQQDAEQDSWGLPHRLSIAVTQVKNQQKSSASSNARSKSLAQTQSMDNLAPSS